LIIPFIRRARDDIRFTLGRAGNEAGDRAKTVPETL